MKNMKLAALVAALLVAGNARAGYTENIGKCAAHPATQTFILLASTGYALEKGYQLYQSYQSGKLQAAATSAEQTLQTSVHNVAVSVASLTDAQADQIDTALKARAATRAAKLAVLAPAKAS